MRWNVRLAIGLLALFQGLYLLLASGRARTTDEHSAHFMAESLWRRGTTAVPQMLQVKKFYGRLGLDGQPYSPYGPGQAVLAVPYYVVLGGPLERWAPPGAALVAREAATSLLSTTAAAVCVALLFALARLIGASAGAAAATAVILGVATPLATYATQAFSEPLVAAFATGAFVALARGGPLMLASASALAGCAFLVRPFPGSVIMVSIFLGWWLDRQRTPRRGALLALAVPFALAVITYLALNALRFGNPMQFGYPPHANGGRSIDTFDVPLFLGLYGLLLSPGKGLLLFAPVLAVAVVGFRQLFRERRGLAVAAWVQAGATLLFFGRYTSWEGGYCFGPRYLVPLLPALVLPLAFVLDRRERRSLALVGLLTAVGLGVEIVGVSTSFLEDQFGGRYYDENFVYRLDYSVASQARLCWQHVASLFGPQALREPLGVGLDFWWVFLLKAGVRPAALVIWGLVAGALTILGAWTTVRAIRAQRATA